MYENIIRADQLTTQGHYVTAVIAPQCRKNYFEPQRVMSHYHPYQYPGLTVFTLKNGETFKVPNSTAIAIV